MSCEIDEEYAHGVLSTAAVQIITMPPGDYKLRVSGGVDYIEISYGWHAPTISSVTPSTVQIGLTRFDIHIQGSEYLVEA